MNDTALAKLDSARLALAECKTVMEAKQISDIAEAARIYLERTNASTETVNRATEIRILAERQMGEFIKAMPKNKGGRPTETPSPQEKVPTIAEVGLTHKQSDRAQRLADIPTEEFQERVETAKAEGKLSTNTILKRPNRVKNLFNFPAWKSQTKALVISWLSTMPEEHREEAAEYLSQLPAKVLSQLNK